MFAVSFHHLMVGIATGSGVLMGLCALLAWLSNWVSNIEDYRSGFDQTALNAGILCLVCLPLSIMSGQFAIADPAGSAILYNKFVYSGLTIGFIVSYIIGRIRFGENLWNDSRVAALQAFSAIGAIFWLMVTGSIGGKLSVGESTLDILPFWPEFESVIALPWWASFILLVLGAASIGIAVKLGPKVEKITE